MASSKGQVLATTELLEGVLLCLPTKDLLNAQGVSKQWLLTIKKSCKIQEALFFKAKTTPANEANKTPELNPLFVKVMDLALDGEIAGIERLKDCSTSEEYERPDGYYPLQPCEHEYHVHIELCSFCERPVGQIPSGSWQEMFITNPPYPIHFMEM